VLHSRYQLLISAIDRYRPLTSFSQKLTFLIDIQIAIFDKYHEKLLSNLEAYLTMTTALGRAMGGVTKEEQERLLGVEGLERLCKTYGSADYLEKAMRDWSDDVVGLLHAYCGRSRVTSANRRSSSWTSGRGYKIVLVRSTALVGSL
jgi:hypothetical protein